MKRNWRIYATFVFAWLGLSLAVSAASALGLWKTVDDKVHDVRSIVRIWEEGGKLKGRVEKTFPRPGEGLNDPCVDCPEPFTGKPKLGLQFLWGFERDGDNWVDGSILDPDNGKIYHCELTPSPDGKSLRVYGYIRVIFKIGRSQTWWRAGEADLKGQGQ
jgi:uncharacterized protein (DUF2147 family)